MPTAAHDYVVLRTIADDGALMTHLPTADRIVATFPGIPGRAYYGEALAMARTIRDAGGWALALDVEDLPHFEPKVAR